MREEEEEEQLQLRQEETKKRETAALTAAVHDLVDVGMDAKAQVGHWTLVTGHYADRWPLATGHWSWTPRLGWRARLSLHENV